MVEKIETSALNEIVEPVCRSHGLELVQVVQTTEHGKAILRIMIDRAGSERGPGFGVTLADCQAVSRDLAPALEAHEPMGGAYLLEVSSPGLDRPLVRRVDYERFIGSEIKVQTHGPVPDGRGGDRRKFQGTLLGVEADGIRVAMEGREFSLRFDAIAKANVVPRFD
jgi:ribosome maturation factor RimP